MTHTREQYIPQGSTKVTDKLSDAVVYLYPSGKGYPAVMGFCGRRQKPDFRYYYKDDAQRTKKIETFFKARQARLQSAKEHRAKLNQKSRLQLGHILTGSWGYDQTNIEAAEVTKVIGKNTVKIRELNWTSTNTGDEPWAQGKRVPNPGDYKTKAVRRKVSYGNMVRLHRCCTLTLWDGKDCHWTAYA